MQAFLNLEPTYVKMYASTGIYINILLHFIVYIISSCDYYIFFISTLKLPMNISLF